MSFSPRLALCTISPAGFDPNGYSRTKGREAEQSHLELQGNDSFSRLPEEVMLLILSHLDIPSLVVCRQVCRRWKRIAGDPSLWRSFIYESYAFSSKNWAKCFGEDVVAHEDRIEELASLPCRQFMDDSMQFSELSPGKKLKDHLMLVRLPKTLTARLNEQGELVGGLTLKSLGQLVKDELIPETYGAYGGYKYIDPKVFEELGDRPIAKSYWLLMTKQVLEGTQNKPYDKQQEKVASLADNSLPGYEVSETLETVAGIFSEYLRDYKTFLFDDNERMITTRCKESLEDNQKVFQVTVGLFSYHGLYIGKCGDSITEPDGGVAAVRRFS